MSLWKWVETPSPYRQVRIKYKNIYLSYKKGEISIFEIIYLYIEKLVIEIWKSNRTLFQRIILEVVLAAIILIILYIVYKHIVLPIFSVLFRKKKRSECGGCGSKTNSPKLDYSSPKDKTKGERGNEYKEKIDYLIKDNKNKSKKIEFLMKEDKIRTEKIEYLIKENREKTEELAKVKNYNEKMQEYKEKVENSENILKAWENSSRGKEEGIEKIQEVLVTGFSLGQKIIEKTSHSK